MKPLQIRYFLFLVIFLAGIVPLGISYCQFQEILTEYKGQDENSRIIDSLEQGQTAFKKLAKLDPLQKGAYKEQFEKMNIVRMDLEEQDLLKSQIHSSLLGYFLFIVFTSSLIFMLLAGWIVRKISLAYQQNWEEMEKLLKKSLFLEEMAKWKDVAQRMSHEIKNHLVPLRLSFGLIERTYENRTSSKDDSERDSKIFYEARDCIYDELNRLQNYIDNFSQFARLPEANKCPLDMIVWLRTIEARLAKIWQQELSLELILPEASFGFSVMADGLLLEQVLVNLTKNAIEANVSHKIRMQWRLTVHDKYLHLDVFNWGILIPEQYRVHIFEPHFSTKPGKTNMGLGLSIVKKILLDHEGDICLLDDLDKNGFRIQLPILDSPKELRKMDFEANSLV